MQGTTCKWHLVADFVSHITGDTSELAPEKKGAILDAVGPVDTQSAQRPPLTVSTGKALVVKLQDLYETETCFFKAAVFTWLSQMKAKLSGLLSVPTAHNRLCSYHVASLEGVRTKPVIRSDDFYSIETMFTHAAATSQLHAITMFTKHLHSFVEVGVAHVDDTASVHQLPAQVLQADYEAAPEMLQQMEEQMRSFVVRSYAMSLCMCRTLGENTVSQAWSFTSATVQHLLCVGFQRSELGGSYCKST
jgi:hypothetical protein